MLLAAGLAVAGVAVYKHKEKKVEWRLSHLNDVYGGQTLRTHVQNGSERQHVNCNQTDDPNVLVQKRIILANLVHGMYERFSKPESDYKQYWEKHYELVPLRKILTSKEHSHDSQLRVYIEKEEKYRYFGVFRKKKTLWIPAAPEWVVAIRGTSTCLHDYVDDLKICLEKLHTSSTVKLLKIVISRLLEDMGFDPKGSKLTEQGTPRDIHNLGASLAVTGHSLGAAKAMLVARKFALRGYLLDSHFFNPPFATLTALARFWARKFFSPIFGKKLRDNCRKILMSSSRDFSLFVDAGKRMRKQRAEYQALSNWSPYLYLNENDPICGLYVSHFLRRRLKKVRIQAIDTWYSVGSTLLGKTLGSAKTFHLMPRAICCIARTKPYRPFSAHKLDNWTREDVPIIVQPSNLEVEVNEEQELLTEKVAGEDIEDDLGEEGEEELESDWCKEEADVDHQRRGAPEEGREQDCGEYTEPTPEPVQAVWGSQSYVWEYPRESIETKPKPEPVQAVWGSQSYVWEYPRESIETKPKPEPVQAGWGSQSYVWEYPRESIESKQEVTWARQSYWECRGTKESIESERRCEPVQAEWRNVSYVWFQTRESIDSQPTRKQVEAVWERQDFCWACGGSCRESIESKPTDEPVQAEWGRQGYYSEYAQESTESELTREQARVQAEWGHQGYFRQ